jgi:hypothetical protein
MFLGESVWGTLDCASMTQSRNEYTWSQLTLNFLASNTPEKVACFWSHFVCEVVLELLLVLKQVEISLV